MMYLEQISIFYIDIMLAPSLLCTLPNLLANGSDTEKNTADLYSGWWRSQASSKKITTKWDKLCDKGNHRGLVRPKKRTN